MNRYKEFIIEALLVFIVLFALISNYLFVKDDSAKNEEKRQNKIEEFDTTNDITDKNMYSVKNIEHEEMARIYFNDYKNMIVNYPDEAYDLVINSDEISKTDFLNYRDLLIEDYYNYNYEKYSYYQENTTNSYVYRVTNTKGEIFTFKTYAVMNYEVNITL